jgi:hypothetical protein
MNSNDKESGNRGKAILGCICLLVLVNATTNAASLWKADTVREIDEYGDLLWRDERPRLDNLYIEMQRAPNSIAYILVYAGRRSCRGIAQARSQRARNYLVNERGIQADRVVTIDGGYREDLTTELFLFPREAPPAVAAPTLDPQDVQVRECRANSRRRNRRTSSRS